jgi:hypothetical protein
MEVLDFILDFKFGKAPGPYGLLNRALKLRLQRAIIFLVALFNAAFLVQYFRTV